MSSSFRQIDGNDTAGDSTAREASRIRPAPAVRPGVPRKREVEHEVVAKPVEANSTEAMPAEQEAGSGAGENTPVGRAAGYYRKKSPIIAGAVKLAEAIMPKRPDYLPVGFETFIGGQQGDSYKVELSDDKLVYTVYGEGYAERAQIDVDPDGDKWSEFWRELDSIGCWGWEASYGEQRTDQSTVFSIEISHEGMTARCSGADAFPPNGLSLAQSDEFGRFCSAVSRLIGWQAFR